MLLIGYHNLWCPTRFFVGPSFFIVYINDLPGVISKNSSVALYADDSKMYRVINTEELDLSTFQSDIDKISEQCKMNKMTINTKTCKIMPGNIISKVNLWEVLPCIKILDCLLLVISHGTNNCR